MSQMCDETILRPSGSVTVIGDGEQRLFRQGAPFVKKIEVAPVSAMALAGLTIIPRARYFTSDCEGDMFDVTTVTASSSSEEEVVAENKYLVGYGDLR